MTKHAVNLLVEEEFQAMQRAQDRVILLGYVVASIAVTVLVVIPLLIVISY